jgi:ubiquinone/menaquinone biosynthesis C-methylase UbiE
MSVNTGGYDDGYSSVPCLWGTKPGSLVAKYIRCFPIGRGDEVLDLGCGEGKNAAALTEVGYFVHAIDCSSAAIANGQKAFTDPQIQWCNADIRDLNLSPQRYKLVVAYGLYHCFRSLEEIAHVIGRTKLATKAGGHHLICVFNDRSHDLSAHPNFRPTLASHDWYREQYSD